MFSTVNFIHGPFFFWPSCYGSFDLVVKISDPQREPRDVIEENMVVEVSVVCLYGHSFVVDPLVYSPFNFRGFTPFAVVPTTLFYVPENIYEEPK
ncbi:hypothetical protein EVAR_91976_1 [Eumeta japonica]|uniref:Uncharacterized protein n=1 Tax=Eumeta variegata TaxID=151549 RepID=A0A4C2A4L7_EUMVA|nr:hypothetical protein EVAR_91976_1 [Eumeta japonica]